MKPNLRFACLWAAAILGVSAVQTTLHAQAPAAPKAEPDVLIFTDGEKLIGELVSAKGATLVFKSNMAGSITVDWKKVQELHTSHPFAVIPKSVILARHADTSAIPKGNLAMHDDKIDVQSSAAPKSVPVADAGNVVAQPAFDKAVNHQDSFFQDWGGTVTAGVSLVQSTQDAHTFTGTIALVRAEPGETWMNPSNRTLFDFSGSYGTLTQPGVPELKTDIYHADAERDQYFSPRLFAFGQAALDHNFSLGLNLQQTYGGGLGWTASKSANEELDVKFARDYIRQNFAPPGIDQSLVGSTFTETYMRKFAHGMIFNEQLAATPAWNNTNAYSATGSASLAIPARKRLSLNLGVLDTFLNDPPPGFKKNSLQFTTGLNYALK
jgi:hypothetical protein